VKRFYTGDEKKNKLIIDPITNLLIFIMRYFLDKRDKIGFNYTMIYYNIRTYTNSMIRQIQYCNKDYFKYTLEHLGKNHLYSVHKTISNAIYYMATEMIRKHTETIRDADPFKIGKFIQECRHRHVQSIRSFSYLYYEAAEKGLTVKIPYETEEGIEIQLSSQTSKVVNDTVKKITVYKIIDSKALAESKLVTKVSRDFSDIVVKNISNLKYSENIRIILELYLKSLTEVKSICGKEFFMSVQKLMATKRSNSHIYFKQQVEMLLDLVLVESYLKRKFESQTSQTQYLSKLFLAYYITMVMRNTIC